MAILVLIHHANGQVMPAVPADVKTGDQFQWVRNGQLGPMLKALAPPFIPTQTDLNTEWVIEADPV